MSLFTKAVISVPGKERKARTPFGADIHIHATSEETGGAFGMWETFTPPGGGPAPHFHTRETEMFRVVHGKYLFQCGAETFVATPGTVVTLPPLVRHSWRNIGDEPGQMFAVVSPGGCEGLFIEIAKTGVSTPEAIAVLEASFGIFNDQTALMGLNPKEIG